MGDSKAGTATATSAAALIMATIGDAIVTTGGVATPRRAPMASRVEPHSRRGSRVSTRKRRCVAAGDATTSVGSNSMCFVPRSSNSRVPAPIGPNGPRDRAPFSGCTLLLFARSWLSLEACRTWGRGAPSCFARLCHVPPAANGRTRTASTEVRGIAYDVAHGLGGDGSRTTT